MHWGSHTPRRVIAAFVAAAALVVPAQAGAATAAGVSFGTLTVTGSGTDANAVRVTSSGGGSLVVSDAVDVTAGTNCLPTGDPKQVTCTGVSALNISLGEGNDTLDSSAVALPTTVSGGNGMDLVVTGGAADTLNGDAGIDGLDGGFGNDTLNGGADGDAAVYASHTQRVVATLGSDNQTITTTGNGQAGESDSLRGFEYLQGGSGNDTLTGDVGGNSL